MTRKGDIKRQYLIHPLYFFFLKKIIILYMLETCFTDMSPTSKFLVYKAQRRGEEASRRAHNPEVVGSNPTVATK